MTAAHDWYVEVTRLGCAMCRAFPVDPDTRRARALDLATIEAHHVLPKQNLKREGLRSEWWDPRNGLGLCRLHHSRHTDWVQRIPRALLPAAVHDFAASHDLGWLLDREYPKE